jgi:hypothetical protein
LLPKSVRLINREQDTPAMRARGSRRRPIALRLRREGSGAAGGFGEAEYPSSVKEFGIEILPIGETDRQGIVVKHI